MTDAAEVCAQVLRDAGLKAGVQRCSGCGEPLRLLYPDAPYRLRWGHVSREAAATCVREPEWPVPAVVVSEQKD